MAVEERAKHLRPRLVEAGGDLSASGNKTPGTPWRIGIQDPRGVTARLLASVDVAGRALATSGDYMQPYSDDRLHHHILDPRTGYSSPELASCTVIAPTAALADGLATAAMVLGAEGSLALTDALPDCEGFFVAKDSSSRRTAGFELKRMDG